MGGDTRLNLLLTHEEQTPFAGQPWYQTLNRLLAPMGVKTFEATTGAQAVELIEHHPIHLAVVDSRLQSISGINVLQLIQKLRSQARPPASPAPGGFHLQVNVHQPDPNGPHRRIEVRFDARPAEVKPDPAVILIAARQDKQLLHEALRFNAFSVLSEPVDVNMMLEVMARALRRFHQNQWPV